MHAWLKLATFAFVSLTIVPTVVVPGLKKLITTEVRFSLLTSAFISSGAAPPTGVTIANGLCCRFPVGSPDAGSRGEMISWLNPSTSNGPPANWPCF